MIDIQVRWKKNWYKWRILR